MPELGLRPRKSLVDVFQQIVFFSKLAFSLNNTSSTMNLQEPPRNLSSEVITNRTIFSIMIWSPWS